MLLISPNDLQPGDSAKINYYSPRFSGFQIGLSYQPDGGQDTIGSDTLSSSDQDGEDVISIGANWVDTASSRLPRR